MRLTRMIFGGAVLGLCLGLSASVGAQSISGIAVTKIGPPNSDTADLDRISTATLVSSGPTSLQARMFGIHLLDVAEFTSGTASDTQANDYTVQFNASAPGDYQLTINTNYSGCMKVVDDTIFGGTATGNAGGVTGFVELGPGLTSGTLNLPDPGIRNTPGETCFNPTASATIVNFSGGSPIAHRLRFQFTNQVISDDDEGAVKFGQASTQGSQTAGVGAGTGATDGHFVNVSLTSFCGNGVVDAGVGEECDVALPGPCCASNCRFASPSTVCRPAAGVCDVPENCTGASAACPADGKSTAVCRPAVDVCDSVESCDGVNDNCPADGVEPVTTVCRPAADVCDVAETCDGVNVACPADAVEPVTTVCRPAADVCDVAETCDGVNVACPADGVEPVTTVCRPAADVCDVAETCDGVNVACPADGVEPVTTVCRPAADVCDVAETCDGTNVACPADAYEPPTTVCRPVADPCDLPENCTGSGASCPADTGLPDADSDTVCDAIDNCDVDPNPGQSDGDADGVGDACDPCTNVVPTGQDRARLTMTRLLAPSNDEGLMLRGFLTNVPAAPVIDPVAKGLRVLVNDNAGGTVLDVTVPNGVYNLVTKTGWKVNGAGTAWTWRGPGTGTNGIRRAVLRAIPSVPGRYKVAVKGRLGSYPVNVANLPLVATVVIDAPLATTGQCGEAKFVVPPGCVSLSSGKTVKCR